MGRVTRPSPVADEPQGPIAPEERVNLTLAALADVDAGRGVDHAEVEAWIDSLGTDKPLPPPTCT